MIDDWIYKLGSLYFWGVVAALAMQLWATTFYLFAAAERLQYQSNLNRVGLSWDPIYLRMYTLGEFKHTVFRYWLQTFVGLLECLLSWFSVAGRVYRIMKCRALNNMLTPEQKQAGFSLANSDFTKEEVLEKLKILDPDLYKKIGRITASSAD